MNFSRPARSKNEKRAFRGDASANNYSEDTQELLKGEYFQILINKVLS